MSKHRKRAGRPQPPPRPAVPPPAPTIGVAFAATDPALTLTAAEPDAPTKAAEAPPPPDLAELGIERWQPRRVHRSEILNAPYNPRVMSDRARARLRDGIKAIGLIDAPVWNARTGNLVGGHQRLATIDAIVGHANYHLTVQAVDLDDKTEREANILLNNHEAQGSWDLDKLAALFRDDHLTVAATGFDVADMYRLFGDSPITGAPAFTPEMDEMAGKLRDMNQRYQAEVRAITKVRDNEHFYVVVVFESFAECGLFLDDFGLPQNRYQDGRTIRAMLEAGGHRVTPFREDEVLPDEDGEDAEPEAAE